MVKEKIIKIMSDTKAQYTDSCIDYARSKFNKSDIIEAYCTIYKRLTEESD
jgi:hypothetical protein